MMKWNHRRMLERNHAVPTGGDNSCGKRSHEGNHDGPEQVIPKRYVGDVAKESRHASGKGDCRVV